MKRLTVVAPAEQVKLLRQFAKDQHMTIYKDGSILKFKRGLCRPVLAAAETTLPAGSFEIYRAYYSGSYNRPAHTPQEPNAVRIKVR